MTLDNRLDEMPMTPLACHTCGARVLVRKSSWNQTSIQWNAVATARCAERLQAERIAGHGVFLVCSALRDSIEAVAVTGQLAMVDAQ